MPYSRKLIVPSLILCGGLAFLPSLGAYFLSDDFVLLSWTRARSVGNVLAFFDPSTDWFYRPLVKVYYSLGQSFFGLHGLPFHLISISIHLINAYLLFKLAAKHKSVSWGAALLVALIFLLNPRHAETVSWVAAVGDLIGALSILGSLLLFNTFVEGWRYGWLAASLAVFGFGLLARESVVVLPVLVGLYWVTIGVRPTRNLIRRTWLIAPYFALLLIYLVSLWLSRVPSQSALSRGGLQFRILNLDSILLGIVDYVHGLVPGGAWLAGLPLDTLRWLVWIEAVVLLGVAWALWRWGRHVALMGLGWMLVTPLVFVPFSGPTDRYFYLPSIGYALLVGDLFGALPNLALQADLRVALRSVSATLGALLVVVPGWGLYTRALAWGEAGRVTGGVLNDTRRAAPDPPAGTRFLYAALPTHLNGVPLFQNGLSEAVQTIYSNPTLSASPLTCDPPPPPDAIILRFKGDGVERASLSQLCLSTTLPNP